MMHYIYIDNFRGFQDQVVSLAKTSFLVGENSTGKSSFLKLLSLMHSPAFWTEPVAAMQTTADLGDYNDMVSAGPGRSRGFVLGVCTAAETEDSTEFAVLRFVGRKGAPILTQCLVGAGTKVVNLAYKTKWVHRGFHEVPAYGTQRHDVTELFRSVAAIPAPSATDPSTIPVSYPLQSTIFSSSLRARSASRPDPRGAPRVGAIGFSLGRSPFGYLATRMAPIRSRPQRLYSGIRRDLGVEASMEGFHMPYTIRDAMQSQQHSELLSRMKRFGESSGMFDSIGVHRFGGGSNSPFELMVTLSGQDHNIGNVGYGVGQVLPLVVDFLSSSQQLRSSRQRYRPLFVVEQPEVHLHPRAQAAFGELVYDLAKEAGHHFAVETHSDYVIDRFRRRMNEDTKPQEAQVLFFERSSEGNTVTAIPIDEDGRYPQNQPDAFRRFFVDEAVSMLKV